MLRRPFTISRGTRETATNVFIKLEKDGIVGFGEAAPNRRYDETPADVIRYMNNVDISAIDKAKDPFELSDYLQRHNDVKSASCALECAYLDWYGKVKNRSVYELLGAQSNCGPISSFTLGLDKPGQIPEKIKEASPYPILKVKLGEDHDYEILEILSEYTDKPLYIDANEGWNFDEACEKIEFMQHLNIKLVEQPLPADYPRKFLRKLKNFSPFPVCADEGFVGEESLSDIKECYDCINIKLMKTGSLIKSLQLLKEAHRQGINVLTGCMVESSLADTATAVLSLWSDYVDVDGRLLVGEDHDPFRGVTLNEKYQLCLPEAVGLGARPVPDWENCCT